MIKPSQATTTQTDGPPAGKEITMENITYQTNEQLWRIENTAASAGYKKTNDCYWGQIFRNSETGHEFSTSREENSTNDPAADLDAMLNPAEELDTEKTVTITITESDAKRLYRACKARAHHFLTMQTEDDEMYKINRAVAYDFRSLAQSIIDQTNVKI